MGHDLVRIVFELEPQHWHDSATERLWAEPVSGGRYRLRNSPFFAYGVSVEDVVFASPRDNGALYFERVSIHAGHSTYRLLLQRDRTTSDFRAHWDRLEALGCSYEEGEVLAVDVPPSSDIYAVYSILEEGLKAGVWDFDEGHCGHPLTGEGAASS